MSLEETLKDLINDVEKLKAIGQESDILDEISVFPQDVNISPEMSNEKNSFALTETTGIELTSRGANDFSQPVSISPEMSNEKNSFALTETLDIALTARTTNDFAIDTTCSPVLECVGYSTLIGHAIIGHSHVV